ncbi:hypothetical protein GF338_04110 [candidate division WOR-3 bacterium]|nr:hypothetical protein [candidate division WOR-3 bacterium]
MKVTFLAVLFTLVTLPLMAQESALEDSLDISGVGFVLNETEDGEIETEPLMFKITALVQSSASEADSSDVFNWQIDLAAMRYEFTTYFLDVLELNFTHFKAYIQPVSVNEYNQTVLGDRIGELELNFSKVSGLPGGNGHLRFKGNDYEVSFYDTDVTNTFLRWVESLK